MRTIVTAVLQQQYSQKELIFWITLVYADVSERSVCSIFIDRRCLRRWNREHSETSAYKIQTPGNYLEESIQHTECSKSLVEV
jgi:hypothetical protein